MKLVITGDGSHTLYVQRLNEHYHSTYGAITESEQVYIRNGLDVLQDRQHLTVFEVGLGTGLNALLTAMAVAERDLAVTYYALEKYPVDPDIIACLNYPDILARGNCDPGPLFSDIHRAPWNEFTMIRDRFRLHKIAGDIHDFTPGFNYDLLYFDAFAPGKQPDMWTEDIMRRLLHRLNPGGVFTTYCVKGAVRKLLKENGLKVLKVPGPPGKREILRGIKEVGSAECGIRSAEFGVGSK